MPRSSRNPGMAISEPQYRQYQKRMEEKAHIAARHATAKVQPTAAQAADTHEDPIAERGRPIEFRIPWPPEPIAHSKRGQALFAVRDAGVVHLGKPPVSAYHRPTRDQIGSSLRRAKIGHFCPFSLAPPLPLICVAFFPPLHTLGAGQARSSACDRSATISSGCSIPIDNRTVDCLTPIRSRTSSGTPEWVVVAG